MIEVANASINTFGISPKVDNVPPQEEEAYFVLSSLEFQSIIKEAINPLKDQLSDMEATITGLNAKVSALEATQEQDLSRVCLDIALDRQRIARLEKVQPGPLQKDRTDILRALIIANGGRIPAKDARQKMRISKQAFSNLLAMSEDIGTRTLNTDRRQKMLFLK